MLVTAMIDGPRAHWCFRLD